VSKLRVYTISDQDDSGRWLRITFPNLYFITSPGVVGGAEYYTSTWSGISGDRRYKTGEMVDFELVDNPWLTENIIENHGPLGARYPKLAYIMEGDTPSFLNLIGNGLASDESPDWGVNPHPAAVGGNVAPVLSLSFVGPSASFGAFVPGVARDYAASASGVVTSTAGNATLSVADTSGNVPGRLVNGTFSLPQALQVRAGSGTYAPVPADLLAYGAPVSNDAVTIGFKQSIGATDALRTGNYAKTLTFTLSTTAP